MEDLSRFTGPVRASSRLAAYRAGLNGQSAAEIGIAAALARATGNQAPLAARTVPTARTVATAKRNATTSATQDRVKIVAAAVERDPALAGKAGEAIDHVFRRPNNQAVCAVQLAVDAETVEYAVHVYAQC